MLEISFGKNIINKNDQRKYNPFFITFPKLHDLNAFPGTYQQQKTYQTVIQVFLSDKIRMDLVDQLGTQRCCAKNDNGNVNKSGNGSLNKVFVQNVKFIS